MGHICNEAARMGVKSDLWNKLHSAHGRVLQLVEVITEIQIRKHYIACIQISRLSGSEPVCG